MTERSQNKLRQAMRGGVHHLASLSGYSRRRLLTVRRPRILMYHAITDGLLAPRVFEQQLRYLKQSLEVVSLSELCQRLARHELRGSEVVLTFDDGVRNHLAVAYPLLQRHQVPATFFVCPGYATSGEWLWSWDIQARLQSLDAPRLERLAQDLLQRPAGVMEVVDWFMTLSPGERKVAEDAVRRASSDFKPTSAQSELYTPMGWSELRQLDPALITIGSHTIDHAILPTLEVDAARREIEGSRAELESQLDREIDLFCYPNGIKSKVTVDLVRAAYRAAVTTDAGLVSALGSSYLLPRIGAPEERATFEWRLHRG